MAGQNFSRAHFVAQAKVAYLASAISALYYPNSLAASWEGDDREGVYTNDDLSGNWWALGWSRSGLVALMFDHESPRSELELSEDERRPLQWLPDLPASLHGLAEQLAARHERLITAGLWIEGKRHKLSDPWNEHYAHGLERLRRYAVDAERALFAATPGQSWLSLQSLSEDHGRAVIRLARASAKGPFTLTPEDEAIVLCPPEGEKPVTPEAAEDVARALSAIGIRWDVPVERLAGEQRAREEERVAAVRAALGPLAFELFEAARSDDAARVRALVAQGAPVDARTVEDQWPHTPAGDTPLFQSIKARATEAAHALIEAGADLAAHNRFGQTALSLAASMGDEALVQALLARGADPNVAGIDGISPLHEAAINGHAAMARALVDAGADRAARAWHGRTPAETARVAGHEALAELLA